MTLPRSRGRRAGSPVARSVALAALALALALAAAGCLGGSGDPEATSTAPTTTSTPGTTTAPAVTRTVRVYIVRDGRLVAEGRQVPATPAVGSEALKALKALLGSRSFDLTIANGVATVTGLGTLAHEGQAEIVATLTQFPAVRAVEIDSKRLTRLDIEDVTPQILLESPLPGDHIASPVQLTGTANTFEATFMVEVLDRDGKSLSRKFVTATSGSGTRGTFATEIGFAAADAQPGTIYVYESSAEDGRPLHEARVPVTLEP